MQIETTRFGLLDIDDHRLIHFDKGLLGFSTCRDYVLIEAGEPGSNSAENNFWWLQSVDLPELAFVVTDPAIFVPTYKVPIHAEQMQSLGLSSIDDAQVLVIVNKRQHSLTGNLQGPLIVNTRSRRGEQMVLSDRRFTTRVPLMDIHVPALVAAVA